MVRAIMSRHEGAALARSGPGDGMTVELYVPIVTLRPPGPRGTPSRQTRSCRVLCVDDESAVLKLTRRVLERAGHVVVAMTSPLDALRRSRNRLSNSISSSPIRPCPSSPGWRSPLR
jgi:hypothetical protein